VTLTWLAETVVGAAINVIVFGGLCWLWAKRKLLPLLRKHGPALLALMKEPER
jgi:hypothetical protein